MNLRAWLQALFYDRLMKKAERACLGRWRAELLNPLRGNILEIGSGTGVNLQYYAPQVQRLVLSEPDPYMRGKLRRRVERSGWTGAEILPCQSERIDLPDACFDHVVSTLVLCSVAQVDQTLREILRLLRPGGSLVLLEHVGADDPGLLRVQRQLEPVWKWAAGNCHLTRATERLLQQEGFVTRLERLEMRGAPSFVRPVIKGEAVRP